MPAVGHPTLDQLHVLVTIADAGSFSAAARRLGRAQSVVSYAVAQLEEQLGVILFDRAGRVPQLTEAGRSLLADARRAGASVDMLRARAAGLQAGLEAELRLAVDVMFPNARLVTALRAFAAAYPLVNLRLSIEALGGVAQLVAEGRCDLGISTDLAAMPEIIRMRPLGVVRLIPVAAPHCPLVKGGPRVSPEAVKDATQIVLTDRTALSGARDIAVLSLKTWRIGDLGAKLALLREGLGWGNMPDHLVRDDLATGGLIELDLVDGRAYDYPLALIQRADHLLGPAATWLGGQFELR